MACTPPVWKPGWNTIEEAPSKVRVLGGLGLNMRFFRWECGIVFGIVYGLDCINGIVFVGIVS